MKDKIRKRYNWAVVILSLLAIYYIVAANLQMEYAEQNLIEAEKLHRELLECKEYVNTLQEELASCKPPANTTLAK